MIAVIYLMGLFICGCTGSWYIGLLWLIGFPFIGSILAE